MFGNPESLRILLPESDDKCCSNFDTSYKLMLLYFGILAVIIFLILMIACLILAVYVYCATSD